MRDAGSGLDRLKRVFADRYDALLLRLSRRLGGSRDLAGDALHEAYVRLVEQGELDQIQHPQSYLLRTAVNLAIDQMRSTSRELSEEDVNAFLDVADEGAGPERQVLDQDLLRHLVQIMAQLPPRQQDIFLSARLHDVSRLDLARRWGISVRQVGRELQAAHQFCLQAMRQIEQDQAPQGADGQRQRQSDDGAALSRVMRSVSKSAAPASTVPDVAARAEP